MVGAAGLEMAARRKDLVPICILDVRGRTPPLPTGRCDTRRAAVGRAAVRRSTVALPQERNFKPDPGSHATAIQRVRAEGSACGQRTSRK